MARQGMPSRALCIALLGFGLWALAALATVPPPAPSVWMSSEGRAMRLPPSQFSWVTKGSPPWMSATS